MKLSKRFRAATALAWLAVSLGVAPGRLLEMDAREVDALLSLRALRRVS